MKINYGDKRWASAFIDAEGYIQFENVKYKRKRIEVTGTDFTTIILLHNIFGGRN